MNCFNCKLSYPKYFKINQKNYCYFCKLIYFSEQTDVYSIQIGYSILNQDEIVKKTKEIILKENKIPSYKEIDSNSKIVQVNPYIFLNVIKMMNNDEKICFSNVKIFFTEDLNIDFIRVARIIGKPIQIKKSNEKITKIQILPHQKLLYEKYLNSYLISYTVDTLT
jgi:hypothetical protein